MRAFLLLPALALAACASPCETINEAQTDPAMQTCVFSASLDENASGAFTPEGGAPISFEVSEPQAPAISFPDGSEIHDKIWVPQGGERVSYEEALVDSARHVIGTAAASGVYALAMQWSGDVRIHSADGERQLVVRVPEGVDESAARIGIRDWPNRAMRLAFASNGSALFASDGQQNVMAWDATTGAERWTTPIPTEGERTSIMDVKPSPDGSRVAVPTYRALHLLDAQTGQIVTRWGFPDWKHIIGRVVWTRDGQHVAVQYGGGYSAPVSLDSGTGVRRQTGSGSTSPPKVVLLRVPS
ncbi:MAG: hypothetical protein AAF170_00545 [Bacteroidota bacterium]